MNVMLRGFIVTATVALVLGAAPSLHAESAVQADKCVDLQDRCLHHEAVVCRVWQSECMHPRQATRRGSHGKRHGSRRHRV
jgi:hypothetical protein